jgi:probable LLM family oxidoreductase
VEIGVFTFADVREGETAEQRLREVIEEVELADEVGLDVFGVGEHHRPEFAVSAPAVVLAAAAARTKRIRLTSAVTVLSSAVPIRLYQQFATLDLLSGGRAEMMVGRGSFIESFPLFGFDLRDYDRLFEEKLVELLHIRETGTSLAGQGVYPQGCRPVPVWVAVGGTPESAVRAGALGLPMALAIIGGLPERFRPFADIHRRAAAEAGHEPLSLSINSHGYIAETTERALDESFPYVSAAMNRIGRERGWPPLARADYDRAAERRGANFVGTPEQVVEKILFQHEIFGHDRFLVQFTVGGIPHDGILRSIELLGREVAPVVRDALGTAPAS